MAGDTTSNVPLARAQHRIVPCRNADFSSKIAYTVAVISEGLSSNAILLSGSKLEEVRRDPGVFGMVERSQRGCRWHMAGDDGVNCSISEIP